MTEVTTIIHLPPDIDFNQRSEVYTYNLSVDYEHTLISAIKLLPKSQYPFNFSRFISKCIMKIIINRFHSIGIKDGDTVKILYSLNEVAEGYDIYAYGSTVEEKWILSGSWKVVSSNDKLIRDNLNQ